MSRRLLLAAATIAAACSRAPTPPPRPAPAPPLLALTEIDQDGGIHHFTGLGGARTVDINSQIGIRINRDSLRVRIRELFGDAGPPVELVQRMAALRQAATEGSSALAQLTNAVATHSVMPSQANKEAVIAARSLVADRFLAIAAAAPEGSALRARLNTALDPYFTEGEATATIIDVYATVFREVAAEADRATAALDEAARRKGVYVQLGAAIVSADGTRPIHVPGFDVRPVGAPVVIERWSFVIPDEERRRFEQEAQRAREINSRGDAGLVQLLGSTAPSMNRLVEGARQCVISVAEPVRTALGQGAAAAEPALDAIRMFGALIEALRARHAAGAPSGSDAAAYMNQVVADLERVRAELPSVTRSLTTLRAAVSATVSPTRQDALDAIGRCEAISASPILEQAATLRALVEALRGTSDAGAALAAFDDKVLRLDVVQVPTSTTFSLVTAGPRRPDEQVLVALRVGNDEEPAGDITPARSMVLHRALPHIQAFAGMLLAQPSDREETQVQSFQAAPSYSFVFKPLLLGAGRSNVTYQRLINPGLGLNVVALDFDKDDQLELGVGGTLSIVRDILQFGGGYNLQQERSYWFFGLRLPLPAGTIGGGTTASPSG